MLQITTTMKYTGVIEFAGISSLVNCAQLEDLPELPTHDEERLQRAAHLLQQRLILRQWLVQHSLQHHYQRYQLFNTLFYNPTL